MRGGVLKESAPCILLCHTRQCPSKAKSAWPGPASLRPLLTLTSEQFYNEIQMRWRLSRVSEAAPFHGGGCRLRILTFFNNYFWKAQTGWHRHRPRVRGGRHPCSFKPYGCHSDQNTCVPLRSSGSCWSGLTIAVYTAYPLHESQAHSSHYVVN